MSAATPGPWAVYQHPYTPDRTYFDVVGATRDDNVAENVREADAHLIAAAPRLLAAASALLEAAEKHIFGDECLAERNATRVAIGRARGSSIQNCADRDQHIFEWFNDLYPDEMAKCLAAARAAILKAEGDGEAGGVGHG